MLPTVGPTDTESGRCDRCHQAIYSNQPVRIVEEKPMHVGCAMLATGTQLIRG